MLLLLPERGAAASVALYGVTFENRQLIVIDTNTGAGSLVAEIGLSLEKPYDLSARGQSLLVYAGRFQSNAVVEIDPLDGHVLSQRRLTNAPAGGEGSLDFRADGVGFCTTSTESTGTLFRVEWPEARTTWITVEGGLSPSFDGLAFDLHGTLYGLRQGGSSLYRVNPLDGRTTLVGNTGISFSFGGLVVGGLAFGPDGSLYAALGGAVSSRLFRIDPATGLAATVGEIGFPGVSGIRFFTPPPGPLSIHPSGTNLLVSWPHARGGLLQVAPEVTGMWEDAPWTASTNGNAAGVAAPLNHAQQYFRLRLPVEAR